MTAISTVRLRAAAVLAGLSLLLSGCFVSPGKFTAELQLLDNDQFTFTYEGEVFFLGLSRLAEMQQERTNYEPEFRAYCYGPIGDGEASEEAVDEAPYATAETAEAAADAAEQAAEAADRIETVAVAIEGGRRDCTPEEEAEQRAEWEERQERRKERDRQQMEQFSKLIGGIDPSDPDAEQELARLLERQKGFDKVVAKGKGLFEVSYSISGTLQHDYMFPMMEDFPTTDPFVQLFLRDGDVVRINAPAFAPPSVKNPLSPMMAAGGIFGSGSGNGPEEVLKDIPVAEGTFTIVTTGDIRANNTDEGPVAEAGRQRLTWTINNRSTAAPTALIALRR